MKGIERRIPSTAGQAEGRTGRRMVTQRQRNPAGTPVAFLSFRQKDRGSLPQSGLLPAMGEYMTKEEKKQQDELWKQEKLQERREELEKIKNLGFRAKLRYFWDYYKIVPIIIGVILFIVYMVFNVVRGVNTDMLLYVCTINCDELDPGTDQLKEAYIEARGGIEKSEQMMIDSSLYVDPEATGTSQRDVAASVKITSYVGSGAMDVFLAPSNVTDFEQKNGFYMALDDLLTKEEIQRLGEAGCLYYAKEPETDEDGMLLIYKETEQTQEEDFATSGPEEAFSASGQDQSGEDEGQTPSETLTEQEVQSVSSGDQADEESRTGAKSGADTLQDTEADTESAAYSTAGNSPRLETEYILNTEKQDDMHIYGIRTDQGGLLEKYQIYYDRPVWFSVIANSSHTEEAMRFLHFLLGEDITAQTE